MRLFFYSLNAKRCWVLLSFIAVQYLLAFMILHANAESVYNTYSKLNYISVVDNAEIYWLNGVVSSYVRDDDQEGFIDLICELESSIAVEKVGYANEGNILIEGDGYKTPLLVMNEAYAMLRYQLQKGQWFDSQKKETQFILGGNARKKFEIGDTMTILVPVKDEQNRINYVSHSGVVIGFLTEHPYTVDLNYAASEPEFGGMLLEHESIVLSNDESLLNELDSDYPRVSLLVKAASGRSDDVSAYLSQYGKCVSFSDIAQYSHEAFTNELYQMLIPNISMIIIVIYGIAGITYLYISRSMPALSVYEMCGQSAGSRRRLVYFTNGLPLITGALMSFILCSVESVKKVFYINNIWTAYHFFCSLLLASVFFLIMKICADTLLHQSIISNMKQSE